MSALLVGEQSRAVLLTPRGASHSLAAAALSQWHPNGYQLWQQSPNKHPALFLPNTEWPCDHPQGLEIAVVLRDPIERFRSMCAHRPDKTTEEHLANPVYGPLDTAGTSNKYFLFETELQECADWLGLSVPLPHLDASAELDKPSLSEEQTARVREIYADDVALWESLQ